MTTPPPLDLAALRKTAEAVPGDTWYALGSGTAGGDHWYVCDEGEAIATIASQDGINEEEREPLARHIAAFDPPTVLALLDRAVTAEATITRVRELHKPITRSKFGADGTEQVCAECVEAWSGDHDNAPWPCSTIAALDGGAS